jgi:hypothetical protein
MVGPCGDDPKSSNGWPWDVHDARPDHAIHGRKPVFPQSEEHLRQPALRRWTNHRPSPAVCSSQRRKADHEICQAQGRRGVAGGRSALPRSDLVQHLVHVRQSGCRMCGDPVKKSTPGGIRTCNPRFRRSGEHLPAKVYLPVSARVNRCHRDGPYRVSEGCGVVPRCAGSRLRVYVWDGFLLSILLSTLFERHKIRLPRDRTD